MSAEEKLARMTVKRIIEDATIQEKSSHSRTEAGRRIVSSMTRYRAIALLWLCFVVRGLYYATVTPLWEGYDEYSHYAYLDYLIHNGNLPKPGVSRNSVEVEASLRADPLPWTQQQLHPGVISYDRWWTLAPSERARRLAAVPASHAEDPAGDPIYEAQQPPLYYWTMAPVLAASERLGLTLEARVRAVRYVSVLLCSLALPLGWMMAALVLGSDALAAGAVAVAVGMPEFLIDIARVGNESMAVVAGTALAYACVLAVCGRRGWKVAILMGATLAACLLTKVYFLSAIPAVCAIALVARSWKAAAALPIAAVLAGWWYRFIYLATGDPTGMIQSVALHQVPVGEKLRVALHLNWVRGIDVALFSHLWFGGWSFLQVKSWMYHVFYLIFAAGLVGLVLAAVRGRWRPLAAPALLEVGLCAGLAYHVVLGQIGYGAPMTSGWYLYCMVFAEVALLAAGWNELVSWRIAAPVMAALFALLDLYGLTVLQIPYYTGLTRHLANGRLAGLQLSQMPELAGRLGIGWLAYLAATLCTVAVAIPWPTKAPRRASEYQTGTI